MTYVWAGYYIQTRSTAMPSISHFRSPVSDLLMKGATSLFRRETNKLAQMATEKLNSMSQLFY